MSMYASEVYFCTGDMGNNTAYYLRINVKPDGTGYYAKCPKLRGVFACGETERDAITDAKMLL